MKVFIKNMVCRKTKFYVLLELERLGINYRSFESGEIDLENDLSLVEIRKLDFALRKYGLEIVFKKTQLVTKIQEVILDMLKNNTAPEAGFPYYVSQMVGYNYTYLNKYFTKETGVSIEEYYTEKKNEKLRVNEPTWSDGFSSQGKSA